MAKQRYAYRLGHRSLRRVCPSLSVVRAKQIADELGAAMHRFPPVGGWDPETAAHFVAQCAHESGEFRYVREIWGPTAVQAGYWRRFRDLGNWLPRHGRLFRGAGWIQTTGRRNFIRAARRLGIKLATLAARANEPRYASLLAAIWWQEAFPHGAERLSVRQVSQRVNGSPPNGLARREMYYRRARPVGRFLIPRRRRP